MADAPAEPAPQAPAAANPPAEGEGAEGEKVSKKGAKKAEAKAKKEAEKARKAAEREAAEAAKKAAGGDAAEDLAKDNYGPITPSTALDAPVVKLSDISEEHVGKSIQVSGWVQRTRMQGVKMCFIEFRANRGWTVQGVIAASGEGKPVSRPMVKWIGNVSPESYVLLEATVQKPLEPVKSCRVSDFELHVTKLYLVAAAPRELGMSLATSNRPITSFEDEDVAKTEDKAVEEVQQGVADVSISTIPGASLATHLSNVVLHKRAPAQQAIAYCRKAVRKLFAEYLEERGFTQFEPPCLIGAASEGGGNVFGMPYFEKTAYLAQSPQFYKQFEIAAGFERVYSIGPVFRAENSNTPRHLTEFTGLDLEMEIGTQKNAYHETMDILEGVLLYIFRGLKERCAEHIEAVRAVYPSEDFLLPKEGEKTVRLTFAEGQKLLREEGPEEYRNVTDDEDMSTPQEKALGALIRKKYNTDFYILDKFPETARPFYALEDPENPKVTNAYDFFMRGQEILSGGQRIHDPDTLVARIKKKGVDPESQGIKQYVSVFREAGCPPHAGGGIGLDRVVAWYLNLPSVHLASYYPRTPKRLMP
ncbi:aspartyl-tRNA synthetase [Plectosphaerella plurivora]|uniref:Probable aspartate--tRNA ligase, cytoplasmic n=1 Tax=Plectosphaerella plurivora TaxID=936078 RepID=A0A9P8VMM2_9PEZI|nr:aspartyl-tRNA synthetase [Plectosphaerella plurivora]